MRIDWRKWRFGIVVLACAAAFGGVYWWPTHAEMNRLTGELERADKELLGVQDQTDGLSELFAEVERLRGEIRSSNRVIPTAQDLSKLMLEFSTHVGNKELKRHIIKERPTIRGKDYHTLPLEITFEGNSMAVFRFVKHLETMPRLVQVKRMTVNRQGAGRGTEAAAVAREESPDVSVTLEMNTFFYPTGESD